MELEPAPATARVFSCERIIATVDAAPECLRSFAQIGLCDAQTRRHGKTIFAMRYALMHAFDMPSLQKPGAHR